MMSHILNKVNEPEICQQIYFSLFTNIFVKVMVLGMKSILMTVEGFGR